MRKRLIIVAIMAVMVGVSGLAQGKLKTRKVDFNHIKVVIENPNNIYYYPKLMRKFLSDDTTMTVEAYRNLYYG